MNGLSEQLSITRIRGIYTVRQSRSISFLNNSRRSYALVYKCEGNTVYSMKDASMKDADAVSDKNHVVLLPTRDYRCNCIVPGLCILIDFESASTIDRVMSFPVSNASETERLFRRALREWSLRSPGYEYTTMSIFYEVLARIELAETGLPRGALGKKLLPALSYMEEHYAENDISNETLSSLTGMSTVYFRKTFNALYGVSPIRYLNGIRTEHAKELLLSGFLSVTEVGEALGFANVYVFSRFFKKQVGMSPTEFIETSPK